MLFVIHYSFDLRFNDVDVAFVLGSFCLGLILVLEAGVLVLVLMVDVLLTTLRYNVVTDNEQQEISNATRAGRTTCQ